MKLKQFQSHLQKEGIDLVFLIHPDSNIIYFTQMKPSFALLLITPSSAELYLSKLDLPPKIQGITVTYLQKDWEQKLADSKVKKIGVCKSVLSLQYAEKERQSPSADEKGRLILSKMIQDIYSEIKGLELLFYCAF